MSRRNLDITVDLSKFMQESRERNAEEDLTSILLSTDKFYLHLIEGRRAKVNTLYNKINKDPKHFDCTIIRYVEIKKREFAEWHAEHVDVSEFIIGNMNLLLPNGDIDINTILSSQAVTMIRRIHAHLQIRKENSKKPHFIPLTDK